jgi:hypothetical protein
MPELVGSRSRGADALGDEDEVVEQHGHVTVDATTAAGRGPCGAPRGGRGQERQ